MITALVQMECIWEDAPATCARVRELVASAQVPPGALLILPELFATGFSLNTDATGAASAGVREFITALAAETGACVLAGVVGEAEGRWRNELIAVAPDGTCLARYAKQRPFSLVQEGESYHAGSESVVFSWGGFRIAPLICYDLRFPELFRSAVAQGAEVFAVVASWPVKRDRHWITLLQARAIENQAYAVGVNRCGSDPHFTYSGRSLAVDPHGTIIADASSAERVVMTVLDPHEVQRWREAFPALRDAGLLP
jgi:omega-amidase